MAPKFSVVIPTYNQAEYLDAALKSVLGQTFQDFEVLVVNNYSTDSTLEIVARQDDPRLRSIDFRNHGVIAASRNKGIEETTGEYVAFLDSDDSWHEEKLERVAQAIKADPEAGLFCHAEEIVRDSRVVTTCTYGPRPNYRGNLYDYLILEGNVISTSATVVARDYLDQVGGFSVDPELVIVEDYDLWLRLSKVCRFQFIKEVLGAHRFHDDSTSARVEAHLKSSVAILDKYSGGLRASHPIYPRRVLRRRYAKVFYFAARQYQRQGDFRKSLAHYAQTLGTYPFHLRSYAGLGLLLADRLLGTSRRKRMAEAVWGPTWRWG